MKIVGLDHQNYEVIERSEKYGTSLIKLHDFYYFINHEGLFIPHNYHENQMDLCDYDEMQKYPQKKSFQIKEIEKLNNNLFRFNYWRPGKRSDFTWDEYPTGYAHISGRRMFYRIKNNREPYLKEHTLKEHEFFYELILNYPNHKRMYPKVNLFFSKNDLAPQFGLFKNENGDIVQSHVKSDLLKLNDFNFEMSNLKKTFKNYYKYFSEDGSRIDKSWNYKVRLACRFNKIKSLIANHFDYSFNEETVLGIISGKYFSEKPIKNLLTILKVNLNINYKVDHDSYL